MSYCRWSCENYYCDAYVYENVAGYWVTHLASNRYPPGAPLRGLAAMTSAIHNGEKDHTKLIETYNAADQKFKEWEKENKPFKIDHPKAGKSFFHCTPGECADNLECLQKEGFVIPQYAIDGLREEQAEVKDD
jgi:hypothetical protein